MKDDGDSCRRFVHESSLHSYTNVDGVFVVEVVERNCLASDSWKNRKRTNSWKQFDDVDVFFVNVCGEGELFHNTILFVCVLGQNCFNSVEFVVSNCNDVVDLYYSYFHID